MFLFHPSGCCREALSRRGGEQTSVDAAKRCHKNGATGTARPAKGGGWEVPAAGNTASLEKQREEPCSHQKQSVSDYTVGFSTDRSTEDFTKEHLLHLE